MIRVIGNTFAYVVAVLLCLPIYSQTAEDEFHEGCCLNRKAFPRPKEASRERVPDEVLFKALNCATSSKLVGNASQLAAHFGTGSDLIVAYYYGTYMPEQSGPALTLGVYSRDGRRGMLVDLAIDKDEYAVTNIPLLRKSPKEWRVGEIDGGLWTYTRLYYLAQEIGARPPQSISPAEIVQHHAAKCWVLYERIP